MSGEASDAFNPEGTGDPVQPGRGEDNLLLQAARTDEQGPSPEGPGATNEAHLLHLESDQEASIPPDRLEEAHSGQSGAAAQENNGRGQGPGATNETPLPHPESGKLALAPPDGTSQKVRPPRAREVAAALLLTLSDQPLDAFRSLGDLAEQLGTTRQTLYKALELLRKEGIPSDRQVLRGQTGSPGGKWSRLDQFITKFSAQHAESLRFYHSVISTTIELNRLFAQPPSLARESAIDQILKNSAKSSEKQRPQIEAFISSHLRPGEARWQCENRLELEIGGIEVFLLALQGKDWNAPEVAPHLPILRLHNREPPERTHERLIQDVIARDLPGTELPLSVFDTPAAQAAKQGIEGLFSNRSAEHARQVQIYVLDLGRVASAKLQNAILGMQGAELMKQRGHNFTLGLTNGYSVYQIVTAPNLKRGDIMRVDVLPLAYGRNMDNTSGLANVETLVSRHEGYEVNRVIVPEQSQAATKWWTATHDTELLAFMGIGSVEDSDSLFAGLLAERGVDRQALKDKGVIGNVLYHLIREDPSEPSWDIYNPPGSTSIRVDFGNPSNEFQFVHTMDLDTIRSLVEIGDGQIVIIARDPSRARIVRAALEMRWANAVICSLGVAEELHRLLKEAPLA